TGSRSSSCRWRRTTTTRAWMRWRRASRPRANAMPPETTGQRISLSLVSHTNAGKTTLARTLLGADLGMVRDEAHVTDEAEDFVLARTPEGEELHLWVTPGFGDSHRHARRLERSENPFGWL